MADGKSSIDMQALWMGWEPQLGVKVGDWSTGGVAVARQCDMLSVGGCYNVEGLMSLSLCPLTLNLQAPVGLPSLHWNITSGIQERPFQDTKVRSRKSGQSPRSPTLCLCAPSPWVNKVYGTSSLGPPVAPTCCWILATASLTCPSVFVLL